MLCNTLVAVILDLSYQGIKGMTRNGKRHGEQVLLPQLTVHHGLACKIWAFSKTFEEEELTEVKFS